MNVVYEKKVLLAALDFIEQPEIRLKNSKKVQLLALIFCLLVVIALYAGYRFHLTDTASLMVYSSFAGFFVGVLSMVSHSSEQSRIIFSYLDKDAIVTRLSELE
ncbi:MAG: hypothetical protein V4732_14485 [Pseudomonadota bacterium]